MSSGIVIISGCVHFLVLTVLSCYRSHSYFIATKNFGQTVQLLDHNKLINESIVNAKNACIYVLFTVSCCTVDFHKTNLLLICMSLLANVNNRFSENHK